VVPEVLTAIFFAVHLSQLGFCTSCLSLVIPMTHAMTSACAFVHIDAEGKEGTWCAAWTRGEKQLSLVLIVVLLYHFNVFSFVHR